MLTFMLAMVLYPQVQYDAQFSIDQAVHDRLPTLEDRDENRLPIIDAIMKECLRWAPPGTLGRCFFNFPCCFLVIKGV